MRTQLKINHAYSMCNGIRFYSKRHKGYVAIATVDEQGEIATKWTTMKEYRKSKGKHEKIAEIKDSFILALYLLPFVLVFSMLLVWASEKDPILSIRILLIGYSLLLLSVFIVTTNRERKKEKNAYRFHSAEHMVLNAYRKLRRVPTLEEIRQYSRFSNSCGTNFTAQIITMFTLIFACTFMSNSLYREIGILLAIVIVSILLKRGCLNFLQKFTTIIPTDKELAVAIEGMNVWIENEKKEKERSKIFRFLHRLFPRVFN